MIALRFNTILILLVKLVLRWYAIRTV